MKKITKIVTGAAVGLAAATLVACTVNKEAASVSGEMNTDKTEKTIPAETDKQNSDTVSGCESGTSNDANDTLPNIFSGSSSSDDTKLSEDQVSPDTDSKLNYTEEDTYQPYYGCPPVESTDVVKPVTE